MADGGSTFYGSVEEYVEARGGNRPIKKVQYQLVVYLLRICVFMCVRFCVQGTVGWAVDRYVNTCQKCLLLEKKPVRPMFSVLVSFMCARQTIGLLPCNVSAFHRPTRDMYE